MSGSLNFAASTSSIIKATFTPAFATQLPGVNGLGIPIAWLGLAPGSVIPMHTHPGGSELFSLTQGVIMAGFIYLANTVYIKVM